MRPKTVYLLLSVTGVVVPLTAFVPWVQAHGLDVRLMASELFANRVSAFFGLDVIVSAVVVVLWASVERTRRTVPFWWSGAGNPAHRSPRICISPAGRCICASATRRALRAGTAARTLSSGCI